MLYFKDGVRRVALPLLAGVGSAAILAAPAAAKPRPLIESAPRVVAAGDTVSCSSLTYTALSG